MIARSDPQIVQAARILRESGLVAFPTETVYGLGADANNFSAVQKIFMVKNRPFHHPFIVHIAALAQLNHWARDISPAAFQLAKTFWPGPLTLVLKKQLPVLDIVTGGQDTIGIRIPRHPIAQALLQEFGSGIAAPSANKFTHISPTTAKAVYEELGTEIDCILDGGTCEIGLESTIIDMSTDQPIICRPGMLQVQTIADVLGSPILSLHQTQAVVRTPGVHPVHYAPTTETKLMTAAAINTLSAKIANEQLPIACVIYSQRIQKNNALHYVSMPDDPIQYAHELYQTLRALDHQQFKQIIVEQVPESVEWDAIRDRLSKASK